MEIVHTAYLLSLSDDANRRQIKPILEDQQRLKSLCPIHFLKIRISYFLGNTFLVKMYKLFQNRNRFKDTVYLK